ncbi:MAG: orotidine-5'-phosphate decarboxylase [Chitinophagaceae bacterium]|nr:orotidine-5'-phosphate decarboxylase [Chitinophagaceae bacterium]
MTIRELTQQIRQKKSYLCVGLDSDIAKIPRHLHSSADPVFEFNKQIIDATLGFCVSYKINTAFYESRGVKGWESLEKTIRYIPGTHFTIADAKRGDIGNTSSHYAKAFFEELNFDAVTVAPYMGADSIQPFLEYENKCTIVLGLTSNAGAKDFELLPAGNERLYEKVLRTVSQWGTPGNLMFVIGATQADEFVNIRRILPDHYFLVPGVGFQGGSLKDISEKAMNDQVGLLVNVSRAIIFAGEKEDFAAEAANIASQYQKEMSSYL